LQPIQCPACGQELGDDAANCGNCGATVQKTLSSPLLRFSIFYFAGGLLLIVLCRIVVDSHIANFVALNWLAVGFSVACIAYGMPRKDESPVAGFVFFLGIGWLVLLLIAGTILIWQKGVGVEELRWLLQ